LLPAVKRCIVSNRLFFIAFSLLNYIGGRYESRVILVTDRGNTPMKSLDSSEYFTETDLSLLKNLSNHKKLELIAALSLSMIEERKDKELAKTLFGAFQTEKSAEQLIEEIRQFRCFDKKVEAF